MNTQDIPEPSQTQIANIVTIFTQQIDNDMKFLRTLKYM